MSPSVDWIVLNMEAPRREKKLNYAITFFIIISKIFKEWVHAVKALRSVPQKYVLKRINNNNVGHPVCTVGVNGRTKVPYNIYLELSRAHSNRDILSFFRLRKFCRLYFIHENWIHTHTRNVSFRWRMIDTVCWMDSVFIFFANFLF